MWKQNGCPKCGRDIFIYTTASGSSYERCYFCGYQREQAGVADNQNLNSEPVVIKGITLIRRNKGGDNQEVNT